MTTTEQRVKCSITVAGVLFSLLTVVLMLPDQDLNRVITAVGTVLLVLVPMAIERWMGCRIRLSVYIFTILYALGPMVGHCWYVYYLTSWWDKLLHFFGGVMFALIGAVCFERLSCCKQKAWMVAIFSLCFSVTIAAFWEFAEFSMDLFFGMDMQNDTVITEFSSYLLGETVGTTGYVGEIQSVLINGQSLPWEGYLDIGIIDTMMDMLWETAGALAVGIWVWKDAGKHPVVVKKDREKGAP